MSLTKATEKEYEDLGLAVVQRDTGKRAAKGGAKMATFSHWFKLLFGTMPCHCCRIWNMLLEREMIEAGGKKEHILWACLILKVYWSKSGMANLAGGVDEKTFCYWGWYFLEQISWLGLDVIRWENRKKGDVGNDCLTSINCTHVPTN